MGEGQVDIRREPPEAVTRQLRTEVGFGCPVADCREPFLSWHHFDPPWRERPHHDPEGMVALCLKHHAMADRNVFSSAQLREFKRAGRTIDEVRARFEWTVPSYFVRMGSNYSCGARTPLKIDGRTILALSENAHRLREVTYTLRDAGGGLVAAMVENGFVARSEGLYDLRVDTGATRIKIWSEPRDVVLDIHYRKLTREELDRVLAHDLADRQRVHVNDWVAETGVDADGRIPMLDVRNMKLYSAGMPIVIRDGFVSEGFKVQRSVNFGEHVGISFNQ